MRNRYMQMSLMDTYNDVSAAIESAGYQILRLLDENIDLSELIPLSFYSAFYRRVGRNREYSLESFIWFCLLQKLLGIQQDSALLAILHFSAELRDFCGFLKVPDASKITRFKQDFVDYIEMMFDKLVDITEPICREMDPKKADYLIYDTTGIEAYVAENNPKFLNAKLKQAKKYAKKNPGFNPLSYAYSQLPEASGTNPFVKQQYINGHFCYAHKAGILTNGLGIVREIAFFDETFRLGIRR